MTKKLTTDCWDYWQQVEDMCEDSVFQNQKHLCASTYIGVVQPATKTNHDFSLFFAIVLLQC